MQNYEKALDFIKSKIDFIPEVGLILGSGLQGITKNIQNRVEIPYADIPHFVDATAPNHQGSLIIGRLSGKNLVCMQGRFHYYEGHSLADIIFPIRLMWLLGVKSLIVTNAAGGINPAFKVGDIMQITDHINLTGTNPLIGKNDDRFGQRFFDMTQAYDLEFLELARKVAEDADINLQTGVYLGCTGPSFETPAEIRAFSILGADAVGMSTVFEVIAAAQMQMRVMGFSLITNKAAGISGESLSGEEVIEVGKKSGHSLQELIERVLKHI